MSDVVFSTQIALFLIIHVVRHFQDAPTSKVLFSETGKCKSHAIRERERDADVRKQKKAARS